jgi:hypothetical protein
MYSRKAVCTTGRWRLSVHNTTSTSDIEQYNTHCTRCPTEAPASPSQQNQYLSRLGLADRAKCSCENDEETVRHLILSCPRWTDERRELREAVGDRSGDEPYLLEA